MPVPNRSEEYAAVVLKTQLILRIRVSRVEARPPAAVNPIIVALAAPHGILDPYDQRISFPAHGTCPVGVIWNLTICMAGVGPRIRCQMDVLA